MSGEVCQQPHTFPQLIDLIKKNMHFLNISAMKWRLARLPLFKLLVVVYHKTENFSNVFPLLRIVWWALCVTCARPRYTRAKLVVKTVVRLLISALWTSLWHNPCALINELSMVLSMSCSVVYLGWAQVMHNGHRRVNLSAAPGSFKWWLWSTNSPRHLLSK